MVGKRVWQLVRQYSEHSADNLETEIAEDMQTVDNAMRVSRPFSTHDAFFVCVIRMLLSGSSLGRCLPQQISHEKVLYFSEVYQRQQEK